MTDAELEEKIIELRDAGASCIDLVTPTHYTERLIRILRSVKPRLNIPVVWNSSGYEKVEVLRELCGLVDIYMPDGAPALSMAKLMSEEMDGCEFHVVNAGTIATFVTGESPEAELCVLPLNAASKLLGTGTAYTMLGTVTHGNLYLLSTNPTPLDSAEAMKGLAGKRIGTIQIENVPGLTLKLILKKYDLAYTQGA